MLFVYIEYIIYPPFTIIHSRYYNEYCYQMATTEAQNYGTARDSARFRVVTYPLIILANYK